MVEQRHHHVTSIARNVQVLCFRRHDERVGRQVSLDEAAALLRVELSPRNLFGRRTQIKPRRQRAQILERITIVQLRFVFPTVNI